MVMIGVVKCYRIPKVLATLSHDTDLVIHKHAEPAEGTA